MAGKNRVELIGRLTMDATGTYVQTGNFVTRMRLATNEPYFINGEKKEITEYHNVVLWGDRGRKLIEKEALQKGRQLLAEGRLRNRSYENKSGQKVWVTEVVVFNNPGAFQLMDRSPNGPSQLGENMPPPPTDGDAPPEATQDDFAE